MKRLISVVATFGAFVLLTIPARADGAGAVSATVTFHNAVQVASPPNPMAFNPCTGAPGILTITYNGVAHATFLTSGVGAGTGWFTFTATGDLTFAQFNGVTYAGKFTAWNGESFNLQNFAATAILEVHATGSDGSDLDIRAAAHITVLDPTSNSPTVVVNFNNLTCG